MKRTEEEHRILEEWPVFSAEDLEQMNDLFPHYLFFRPVKGQDSLELWASCCGKHDIYSRLQRVETQAHYAVAYGEHNDEATCPWCGRPVTLKDLRKAGKRKKLEHYEMAVILHTGSDGALYADSAALQKTYKREADLTARPMACPSSGYRFDKGSVMQIDYQSWEQGEITWERDKLGRKKMVQEPFKYGSISWYLHESYTVLNRAALEEHPFFKWCGYYHQWDYRPYGARGCPCKKHDLISYLTAYAIYPRQVEMLAKVGYWEPLIDLVYDRKKNAGSMCWEEADPRKSFRMDKRELAFTIAVQPRMEALEVRNYVRRNWGKTWDVAFCMDFSDLWGCAHRPMEVLRFLRQYQLDPDRFLRYIDSLFSAPENDLHYGDLFEVYHDYLDAVYHLGYCMDHSRVLWPEDLSAAHDEATRRWAEQQKRAVRKQQAVGLKERRLKYEFEADGLKIVFPATGAAIRREGKVLNHCVGGYADRHMNGVLTILFLRRSSAPTVPLVTIEMRGNKLRQIHGWDDERTPCADNPGRISPRVLYKDFLDLWMRWLKNGSPRDEDGTPKAPKRRKRTAERLAG